jgi:hypothetical protein
MFSGFSVGIVDTIIEKPIQNQVQNIRDKEVLKTSIYVTEVENNPALNDVEIF